MKAVLPIGLSGCIAVGEQEPPPDWENFEQRLQLDFDGKIMPVPLEGMDLWLTEDDAWPETFEIKGSGISLGGTFPRDVRVGYEDDWTVLVGKIITIDARHSTPYEEKASILTVPGAGLIEVLGGQFTIDEVGRDWDAQTPISGQIELRIRQGSGMITLHGRLAVKGTGWG